MSKNITLYDAGGHRNVLLEDFDAGGLAVQTNQHLIIDGDEGVILDPGGHKVYTRVLSSTLGLLGRAKLAHVFLSHQDPDIVAALNGWLMSTDATGHVSSLWTRFVPHFGLDRLLLNRLLPIPDEGGPLRVGNVDLQMIPAHFLHSPGNFHLWDPTSKILYSGDLGASIGIDYREVTDFDAHLPAMEGFHRRYMASRRAMQAWVRRVRDLPIEIIAPQHGAFFRGTEHVQRFIAWCDALECGVDLMT
jgi:flavorubredoxin